jgi:hypothetical protein
MSSIFQEILITNKERKKERKKERQKETEILRLNRQNA